MSVAIHPEGTAELLAGQLAEMRAAGRGAMQQAVDVGGREMRQLAPGRIGQHIEEHVHARLGTVTGVVAPARDLAQIARMVDEGTGVYVDFHSPIRPVAARRAANPRAAVRVAPGVFRRSVKGQRPQRFVERAEQAAEPQVTGILERAADAAIAKLK